MRDLIILERIYMFIVAIILLIMTIITIAVKGSILYILMELLFSVILIWGGSILSEQHRRRMKEKGWISLIVMMMTGVFFLKHGKITSPYILIEHLFRMHHILFFFIVPIILIVYLYRLKLDKYD